MRKFEDIKYGSLPSQVLDVTLPDSDEFTVYIHLHGGGYEHGTHKEKFIPDLVEKGIAVVSGEYRKYPEAKYPEFIEDGASVVNRALSDMHKYGKVKGFYVGGSSAGCHTALMLCFCRKYLEKYGISNKDIAGYFFDAGQPTVHFNVLKEMGENPKRVVVDERAPLYYVGEEENYPPMEFVVSDNDIANRYEQTMLTLGTLKDFGYDMSKISLNFIKNSRHTEYGEKFDENGKSIYAEMIYNFIKRCEDAKLKEE